MERSLPEAADSSELRFETVIWPRSALLEGNARSELPLGSSPWAVWWWLAPLLFIIVGGIAYIWSVNHIEATIESLAAEVLTDAGIDPSGLVFDASYRDLEVSGEASGGVSNLEIETALESANFTDFDVRNAVFVSGPTALPIPEFAQIDVDVVADSSGITLTGAVPTAEHERLLITAANATGANVASNLTVSGLPPAAVDADGQIDALADVIRTLTSENVATAAISASDDGPIVGQVAAISQDAASAISLTAGDSVEVSAPPVRGALDITATFDGERIVLDGTVLDVAQQNRLVTRASGIVGFSNVVNNLNISGLEEEIPGADERVESLAAALRTFDGLLSGDATLNDTDFTVNGVAFDDASRAATRATLTASERAGLRPGGVISLSESLPVGEQIDRLQGELDALRSEIAENVLFEFEVVTLTPEATATLDRVAEALNRYPLPVVEIGGHTDDIGPEEFNAVLSQQRADAVATYLEAQIDPGRLVSVGFGESFPIADNGTAEGQRANRRVEFIAQESF